ncbi:lipase 3-like [Periplaneta americana]|uniref:lipase 3-like n=1 Tax=Periplaneta americana TaxID=6978 RepID=UPI0037E9AF44
MEGEWLWALFLLLFVRFVDPQENWLAYNPDTHLTTPQLVVKYGYPVETHTVLTTDGYFLTLHRIPHGRGNATSSKGRKPVVFLQHGILCSSADWVIVGPGKALAYLLADAGYDVWIGNARGNTYSRAHVQYTIHNSKYWDHSLQEMGVFDLPAALDYVLAVTSQPRLYYIGHSMGTTMFYILLSERPQYNDKVRAMISLSPVAYLSHITSPLRAFSVTKGPEGVFRLLNDSSVFDFLPNSSPIAGTGQKLCRNRAFAKLVCENILFYIGGFDTTQMNTSIIPAVLGHVPAGTSTKVFQHYIQLVRSGRFRQYDYGNMENKRRYGSTSPPQYKLQNVKVPVSLHYSDHDALSPRTDVLLLKNKLPNLIGIFRVPIRQFNHLDFIWGIDVKTLVYDNLLDILRKY